METEQLHGLFLALAIAFFADITFCKQYGLKVKCGCGWKWDAKCTMIPEDAQISSPEAESNLWSTPDGFVSKLGLVHRANRLHQSLLVDIHRSSGESWYAWCTPDFDWHWSKQIIPRVLFCFFGQSKCVEKNTLNNRTMLWYTEGGCCKWTVERFITGVNTVLNRVGIYVSFSVLATSGEVSKL